MAFRSEQKQQGTESIRTKILPSKPKREITTITNRPYTKVAYIRIYVTHFETSEKCFQHHVDDSVVTWRPAMFRTPETARAILYVSGPLSVPMWRRE